MFLTPSNTEKLLLSVAGMVGRDRLGTSREVTLVRFRGTGAVPGLRLQPFADESAG